MDLDILARQLATGLTRMAVAVQAACGATDAPRTLVEQQVLLMLDRRRPEYPIRSLAAELGLTMPTTISAVAVLQREGLVSMDPMPSYSPAEVMVALTARGVEQAPRIRHWTPDLLAAIDELNSDERLRLLGVVIRHIQLMQRRGQIPVTRMCPTCRFFDGYAHPGSAAPHHCRLVDAPFGHRELRLRCPDQAAADEPVSSVSRKVQQAGDSGPNRR